MYPIPVWGYTFPFFFLSLEIKKRKTNNMSVIIYRYVVVFSFTPYNYPLSTFKIIYSIKNVQLNDDYYVCFILSLYVFDTVIFCPCRNLYRVC